MTIQEKIKMLEVSWKDAQKKSENEKLPEAVRQSYDEIAQSLLMKLTKLRKEQK